jgi:hypothetical protein
MLVYVKLEVCSANQRVETYSVYGGTDETSLARPKSASFMTSLLTSKFSTIEWGYQYHTIQEGGKLGYQFTFNELPRVTSTNQA